MIATKETACLTFLALAAGLLVSRGAGLPRPGRPAIAACLGTACFLAVAFYSDFFTDFAALVRPFEAIRLWGARGVRADGHGKPWWYYLAILGREEPVIVALAVAGTARALWRRDRFAMFLAGWGGAILLAYSAIPYKTPWLVLNAVLPLALLGGTVFAGGPRGVGATGDGRTIGRSAPPARLSPARPGCGDVRAPGLRGVVRALRRRSDERARLRADAARRQSSRGPD